jgi:hypothetical protein
MPTLQSLNDAATAVQTAVATLNTAAAAAKAEGMSVELRVNYNAAPGADPMTPGVTTQSVVAITGLPLPLPTV